MSPPRKQVYRKRYEKAPLAEAQTALEKKEIAYILWNADRVQLLKFREKLLPSAILNFRNLNLRDVTSISILSFLLLLPH